MIIYKKKYGEEVADFHWPEFKLRNDIAILENKRNEILF